jgi:capsular polysaccharide export protein
MILNISENKSYFFGFSRWKRKQTCLFFHVPTIFTKDLNDAQKKGLNSKSKIYIWGKKPFPEVEEYAKEQNIPLLRVEDGFVRSVSLGSDLTKAYSLVVDSRGIYFDPTSESDLEHLLNTYGFDEEILERSKKLQQYLIDNKISKYNIHQDKKLVLNDLKEGQRVVMVPGQVEDDASIIYGANGMTNLELLQRARENTPDAYIIYKPHPDVLAGNRKGNIETTVAMKYADSIITNASLDSVLELADEVHTMTSLVGLEALIRGKKVTTYGLPFYAGWGLTIDAKVCKRRTTIRTLDELVAAAFILYPRYIHPQTNSLCEIEVLLKEIDKEKHRYNTQLSYKQYIDTRNAISRKLQLIIKFILGD